jgi:chromosome segregation ATPase
MSADAVATLGAALERQEIANKVLQAALDAARTEIALAQIDAAKADTLRLAAEKGADDLARRLEREETERRTFRDQLDAVRVELSAAEANTAELQAKFDALEMNHQAALDAARAETALTQIDAAKADTLRLAAEKGADDLARRLEREETERRTFQDQVDAVRVELSAAEARAAELQTRFDALKMKRQAASPDGRERILWQEHAAQRIRELEHQLEAVKVAGRGRDEFGAHSPRKRSWWWPFQPIRLG